jgi:hypothetical protein
VERKIYGPPLFSVSMIGTIAKRMQSADNNHMLESNDILGELADNPVML